MFKRKGVAIPSSFPQAWDWMGVRYRYCRLWCALSNRRGSICRDTLRRKTPFDWTPRPIPQLLQSTERFFLCLKRYQSAELSCEPLSHFRLWLGGSTTLASAFAAVKTCFAWLVPIGQLSKLPAESAVWVKPLICLRNFTLRAVVAFPSGLRHAGCALAGSTIEAFWLRPRDEWSVLLKPPQAEAWRGFRNLPSTRSKQGFGSPNLC